jgi:hypothetical protein
VTAWIKRNKAAGEFMAVKKPAAKKKAAKKFKGSDGRPDGHAVENKEAALDGGRKTSV